MKRGDMNWELITAALTIVIIAVAFTSIMKGCGNWQSDQQKAQAGGSLESFVNFLSSLKENQNGSFIIYSPKDYFVVTFDSKKPTIPQCYQKNCVCICKDEKCEDPQSWCVSILKSPGNFVGKIEGNPLIVKSEKSVYVLSMKSS